MMTWSCMVMYGHVDLVPRASKIMLPTKTAMAHQFDMSVYVYICVCVCVCRESPSLRAPNSEPLPFVFSTGLFWTTRPVE